MAHPTAEEVVREQLRRFDEGDVAGSAALFADESLNHGMTVSPALVEAVLRSLRQALPDHRSTILELTTDGEVVVCRVSATGTHLGTPDLPFVEGGVFAAGPPTGRPVATTRMQWYRVRDGRIVEHWANRDDLGVARQLGLLDGTPLA